MRMAVACVRPACTHGSAPRPRRPAIARRPATVRLLLIRHAKPIVDPGVCYGRLDLHAEPAHRMALADRLIACCERPLAVYSSPLVRCLSSARDMAERGWPAPDIDDRLIELDFGGWEGMTWEAIGRPAVDAWAADVAGYRPPGGETVRELAARGLSFVEALRAARHDGRLPDGNVAAFTHAGIMQTLPRALRGAPLDGFGITRVEYGEVMVVELDR